MGALLDEMGGRHAHASHLDPIRLIQRIPTGMPVPKLRDSLTSILGDCRAELALHQSCHNMLKADCLTLHQRLSIEARKGVFVKIVMSVIEQEELVEKVEKEKEERKERALSTDSFRLSRASSTYTEDNGTVLTPMDSSSSMRSITTSNCQHWSSLYSNSLSKYSTAILNLNTAKVEKQAIYFKGGKVVPVSSIKSKKT